jgi:hypothetical protein
MSGSTINPGELYEKLLTANLQRALDFLRFAEAKNAALLGLASAWVVAIINLQCSGKAIPKPLELGLQLALVLALCAGLLAMFSFLPRLNLAGFFGGKRAGPHSKNLLFFGDISTIHIKPLEQEFRSRYWPDSDKGHRDEYLNDLVVQISVNSDITVRKMHLFRWGMVLILVSGIGLLVSALATIL